MDDTARRVCAICKREEMAWKMKSYNTGRRVQYLCPECYKKGRTSATGYDVDMALKRRKDWNK